MARKGKKATQEPWEKSIYETDYEPVESRTSRRKVQKGNALFMRLLVFLIIVIVSVPTAFYLYVQATRNNHSGANNTPQTTETTTQETTHTTTTTDTGEEDTQGEGEDTQEQEQGNVGSEYVEVLPGEGLNALADRTGVDALTIAQLNPEIFDANGNFLPGVVWNAGQQVRVR